MQNFFYWLCGRLQAVACFEVLPYNLENFVLRYAFGNEITSLGPDHFSTAKINFHARPPTQKLLLKIRISSYSGFRGKDRTTGAAGAVDMPRPSSNRGMILVPDRPSGWV